MFDKHKHEYRQHDDGPGLPADLTALERQLARLSPAAPRIDRDRLMFEAGRASVDGKTMCATGYASADTRLDTGPDMKKALAQPVAHDWRSLWPMATATMTAATVLLAALLMGQSRDVNRNGSIAKPMPPIQTSANHETQLAGTTPGAFWLFEATPVTSSSAENYLAMRQLVLTQGLSALDRETRLGATHGPPTATESDSSAAEHELLKEYLTEEAALRYRI